MIRILFAATLALFPVPASAAGQTAAPSVRVPIADLNLHDRAGVELLDRRLKAAVRTLCPDPNGRVLTEARQRRSCIGAAKSSAEQARARALASTASLAAAAR